MTDPIKHVVILAHPDRESFNSAIAKTYMRAVQEAGQTALLRDLYDLEFDPVLKNSERSGKPQYRMSDDAREELALIGDGEIYTLIHPIWFAMPPAILTGYIHRVMGAGVTAGALRTHTAQGVLRERRLLTITTSGAPEDWLDEQGQPEALKTITTRYLFRAFGLQRAEYLHFGGIVEGYPRDLGEQCLRQVADRARHICSLLAEDRASRLRSETNRPA